MAPKEHLQTINEVHHERQRSSDVSFGMFQKLPIEIRLYIWRYSLAHHRLLEVHIEPSDSDAPNPPRRGRRRRGQRAQKQRKYSTRNSLGNLVSGQRTVVVKNTQVYSKLLRVNRESRQAALRFYRVHFPCRILVQWLSAGADERAVERTLYFNPEYDFMNIESHAGGHGTIDLIHDLKAYDPKNVGLLNIAMDRNLLTGLGYSSGSPKAPARVAFVDTLSRLENIVWYTAGNVGRRIVPFDGFPGDRVRFNHSMPVKPVTASFDLLERDPRAVGPELTFIRPASSDPRNWRLEWQQILAGWNVKQAHPPRERVLFAFKTAMDRDPISSVAEADTWLAEEERKWIACQFKPCFIYYLVKRFEKKEPPVESPEELAKAVRPAMGFWLFPIEALGSTEDENQEGTKRDFDLSGYWPELALARLS